MDCLSKCEYIVKQESFPVFFTAGSLTFGRGVEGQGSYVEGLGYLVEGRLFHVEGPLFQVIFIFHTD